MVGEEQHAVLGKVLDFNALHFTRITYNSSDTVLVVRTAVKQGKLHPTAEKRRPPMRRENLNYTILLPRTQCIHTSKYDGSAHIHFNTANTFEFRLLRHR